MANNVKQRLSTTLKISTINKKFLALGMAAAISLGASAGVQAAENWVPNVFNFQLTMAERGHAEAQYLLAGMYADGHGTERDMGLALKWYQEAAANGHSEAQQRLQELNEKGV